MHTMTGAGDGLLATMRAFHDSVIAASRPPARKSIMADSDELDDEAALLVEHANALSATNTLLMQLIALLEENDDDTRADPSRAEGGDRGTEPDAGDGAGLD
jgi:hypothetical protein